MVVHGRHLGLPVFMAGVIVTCVIMGGMVMPGVIMGRMVMPCVIVLGMVVRVAGRLVR